MATTIPALVETSDPPLSTDSDAQFDAKAFPWAASLDPFGQSVSAIAIAARDNAEEALAAALGGDLPPLTGFGGEFLRVKADETGAEFAEIPEQSTATWEAGTSTIEGIVSPAKVKAAIDDQVGIQAKALYNGVTQTLSASLGISSVTRFGTGIYTFNFSSSQPDVNYNVFAQRQNCGADSAAFFANVRNKNINNFQIRTGFVNANSDGFQDVRMSVLVWRV